MALHMSKPRTPPQALKLDNTQLLTPPMTSEFSKQVRFADELQSPIPKRLANTQKLEAYGALDYTELKDNSSDESQGFTDGSSETQGCSPSSSSSSSVVTTPVVKHKAFANLLALDDPLGPELSEPSELLGPFPFMKLPLSVRNEVYRILLVIPAIICVRQKHTCYNQEKQAYLYAEPREYLAGIAYALARLAVDGFKFRFSRYRSTNVNILRVSKEVHAEAKAIMYGKNEFEISTPSNELSPPADFRVPLFPRGYQRLIRKLNICVRAFYGLKWLLNGGHGQLKNAYRGLETLTIIFEMENTKKGYGKKWAKNADDKWVSYVTRLRHALALELFGSMRKVKKVLVWIDLKILFDGDRYDLPMLDNDSSGYPVDAGEEGIDDAKAGENARRLALKHGLVEAFELFKKGGR